MVILSFWEDLFSGAILFLGTVSQLPVGVCILIVRIPYFFGGMSENPQYKELIFSVVHIWIEDILEAILGGSSHLVSG